MANASTWYSAWNTSRHTTKRNKSSPRRKKKNLPGRFPPASQSSKTKLTPLGITPTALADRVIQPPQGHGVPPPGSVAQCFILGRKRQEESVPIREGIFHTTGREEDKIFFKNLPHRVQSPGESKPRESFSVIAFTSHTSPLCFGDDTLKR